MRVLHLIDHFGIGGAQVIVKGILTRNKEQNCFVIRNKKNQTITIENVYFSKTKLKLDMRALYKIKELIIKNNYPIVHCHLFGAYFYGYILKRIWFPDIKLVFHEHGRIFRNQRLYTFFIKYTQNKVDLFIAVSEAIKQKLMKNVGTSEDKIKVLYNFVDIEKFNLNTLKEYNRDTLREKLGIKKDDFVIGFVGRLVERKGCKDLIKAVNLLLKEKKIKLLIAGDGSQKNELERLTKEFNLQENVMFLGYIKDIMGFYSCLDVFVIPSHWEPFGIVGLEAQAMGIPVIASNVEGLNEIITDKETGILFKPKDEKDLAEKIRLVCKNVELRKKLIKKGLENVKRYTLDDYILKLNKIYKMV